MKTAVMSGTVILKDKETITIDAARTIEFSLAEGGNAAIFDGTKASLLPNGAQVLNHSYVAPSESAPRVLSLRYTSAAVGTLTVINYCLIDQSVHD